MSLPRRVVAGFSREVRSFFSLILPNRFACKLKMSAPAKSDPLKRRENEVVDDVAVRSGDGSCGLVRQQETAQGHDIPDLGAFGRSEEHTSELQSLMRISYAVFCLKKKKIRHKHK